LTGFNAENDFRLEVLTQPVHMLDIQLLNYSEVSLSKWNELHCPLEITQDFCNIPLLILILHSRLSRKAAQYHLSSSEEATRKVSLN
jgi:hypothetical protein